MNRRQGSILIMVMILTLVVGAFTAAILATTFSQQRASWEALNRVLAFQAAKSGAAYYMLKLAAQPSYLSTNPAPHAAMQMGSTSFQLESARSLGTNDEWQVVLRGMSDTARYGLNAVIGHRQVRIPNGIAAAGSGNPAATALSLQSWSKVGSYDPVQGPYDPLDPGEDAEITVNGRLAQSENSSIYGKVTSTGASGSEATDRRASPAVLGAYMPNSAGSPASYTQDQDPSDSPAEGASPPSVEDIDPIVQDALKTSKSINDNGVLRTVFGAQWKPAFSAEKYGDLVVTTPRTYVIPSGVYRFRRFEVRNGATVVFDTSRAPSKLVYLGSSAGSASLNDLTVTGGSQVKLDPKGTSNGLLTVLGPECDFVISSNSTYGQAIGDPDSAGYTQIISLGGKASGEIRVTGGSTVFGRLYAAAHGLILNGSSWYGSAVARKADLTKATFAVDAGNLGRHLVDPTGYEVLAHWPAGAP